jgi:hypothetical protein
VNLFGTIEALIILSNVTPSTVPETTHKPMPYSEELNVADWQPPLTCTNPGCPVAQTTKFCTVASNIFVNYYGYFSMSIFWRLEFSNESEILGKLVHPRNAVPVL